MRGWNQIGDEWIYLDKNGNKKTGWITDAGKEYYLDEEGHKVSGFVKLMIKNIILMKTEVPTADSFRQTVPCTYVKTAVRVMTGRFKIGEKQYYAAKGRQTVSWI